MNKRGSLPIVVLVMLTLILTVYTLFVFNTTSNKFSFSLSANKYLENVYVKEDIAKYQIYVVGKNLSEQGLLEKDKFRENFLNFNFSEDYLIRLKGYINQNKFEITEGKFTLSSGEDPYFINDVEEGLNITYYTKLKVDLN
jgi:hypothetical protein